MCEQCFIDPIYYPDPLPGWFLLQARKTHNMQAGQWGLGTCNDPTYVWTTTPWIDPLMGMDAAQEEQYIMDHPDWKFRDIPDDFDQALVTNPTIAYELVSACIEAGYDPKRDGYVEYWLFDHLARHIQKTIPVEKLPPDLVE